MMLLSSYVAPASSGVTSSYIGVNNNATTLTTYTFTGASIGTAASDRIVFVAVSATGVSGVTLSSVTIGGNSASLINTGSAGFGTLGNAYLNVASGTTADIVVTLSGSQNRCSVDVYAVYGSSGAPYDTDLLVQPSTVSTLDTTVNIPANAVAIYSFAASGGTVTSSYSSATENYDGLVGGSSTSRSGATKLGEALNHTETLTMSSTKSNGMFAATVWSNLISYVNQASNSATATTTVAVNKPTGTIQNDILVAFAMTSSSNGWSAPAGWTEVLDTSGRGCFYKVAGASEGSSYTFTLSGTSDLHVVILCYRAASWGQIGTLSASLADPTVAPGITVATDNSLVIDFVTRGSAATYTTPSGWTDIYATTATSTIYLISKAFNSGATGDVTVDATSGNGRSVLIALSPSL